MARLLFFIHLPEQHSVILSEAKDLGRDLEEALIRRPDPSPLAQDDKLHMGRGHYVRDMTSSGQAHA